MNNQLKDKLSEMVDELSRVFGISRHEVVRRSVRALEDLVDGARRAPGEPRPRRRAPQVVLGRART